MTSASTKTGKMPQNQGTIAWRTLQGIADYEPTLAAMEEKAQNIINGAQEEIWLLEHPPLYTAGTSAIETDLIKPQFPVHATGRGGQYTYHGPGQRVAYLMLDLKQRFAPAQPDVRRFVKLLEQWIIATLNEFGVEGFIREGRVGVWVNTPTGEAKIAALGIRLRKWVSTHGISLNVNPDLSHYSGIVPCGLPQYGVTSLHAMSVKASMEDVDAALKAAFDKIIDIR